jgi:hypothetical protein
MEELRERRLDFILFVSLFFSSQSRYRCNEIYLGVINFCLNYRKKLYKSIDEMTRKEIRSGRAVQRIDLSLPIVQNHSYGISCSIPSSHNLRRTLLRKLLVDNDNNKKPTNQPTKIHSLGPAFVVDINTMTAETISTTTDTISNSWINSNYPNRILKTLPTLTKRNKQTNIKDDGDRSRSSSDNRLLYESFGSFDDQNKTRAKNNNMWQNIHHPQLTSTRRMSKRSLGSNNTQLKASTITSFDNLSQESTNDQLYERIEQLTKTFFPTIQQIRHSHPDHDLINNRLHLHRVHERDFMPISSRKRPVR